MVAPRGRCDNASEGRMTRHSSLKLLTLPVAAAAATAALAGCGASHHAAKTASVAQNPSGSTSSAAGQSSGSAAVVVRRLPTHVVAKVGHTFIREADLQALVAQSAVAARKRHATLAVGSSAYRQARALALHQLVVDAALEQAAARLGIVVTPAQVAARLRTVKAEYAGIDPEDEHATQAEIDQKFAARLKTLGMTSGTLEASIRIQVLMEGLYRKVTAHVKPATPQAKAAAMQRWTERFNRRLARQVVYQRGFAPTPHS
jgi:SurA N-terminal domain